MNLSSTKEHSIDFAFTLALFLVFAACALSVVVLSIQSYSAVSKQAESNYNARITMSYLSQKVRHMDTKNSINVGKIGDVTALIMSQDFEGEMYSTYIYQHGEALKELFIKSGSEVDLEAGTTILPVKSFAIEIVAPGLYDFRLTGMDDKSYNQVIVIKTS